MTEFRYCETCDTQQPVVDEFDDTAGYEERAQDWHIIALDCGHDISWRVRS